MVSISRSQQAVPAPTTPSEVVQFFAQVSDPFELSLLSGAARADWLLEEVKKVDPYSTLRVNLLVQTAIQNKPEVIDILGTKLSGDLKDEALGCLIEIAKDIGYPKESNRAVKALALSVIRNDITEADLDGVKEPVLKTTSEINQLLKKASFLAKVITKPDPKCKNFLVTEEREHLEELALDIAIDHKALPVVLGNIYKVLTDKKSSPNQIETALGRVAFLNDAIKIHLKQSPEEALLIILSAYGLQKDYYDDIALLDVFGGEQYGVLLRAGLKSEYFKNESLQCLVHCAIHAPSNSPLREHLFGAIVGNEVSKEDVCAEIIKSHGSKYLVQFEKNLQSYAESHPIAELVPKLLGDDDPSLIAKLFSTNELKIIEQSVKNMQALGFDKVKPVTLEALQSVTDEELLQWSKRFEFYQGAPSIDKLKELWCTEHMLKKNMVVGISERRKAHRKAIVQYVVSSKAGRIFQRFNCKRYWQKASSSEYGTTPQDPESDLGRHVFTAFIQNSLIDSKAFRNFFDDIYITRNTKIPPVIKVFLRRRDSLQIYRRKIESDLKIIEKTAENMQMRGFKDLTPAPLEILHYITNEELLQWSKGFEFSDTLPSINILKEFWCAEYMLKESSIFRKTDIKKIIESFIHTDTIKQCMGKNYIGPEAYKTILYVKDVGIVPPVPKTVTKGLLNSRCPIANDGRTIGETHRLVFVPSKLNGQDLTIASFGEMALATKYNHRRGNILGNLRFDDRGKILPNYRRRDDDSFIHKALPSGQWILMPDRDLPNSRNKTFAEQDQELKKFPDYHRAKAIELVIGQAMNDLQNKPDRRSEPYFNINIWCEDDHDFSRVFVAMHEHGICLVDFPADLKWGVLGAGVLRNI